MRTLLKGVVLATALLVVAAAPALAWQVSGHIYCEGTGLPMSGVVVTVVSTCGGTPFSSAAATAEDGSYVIGLPEVVCCYRATVTTKSGESVVTPASGYADFCITDTVLEVVQNWILSSPVCVPSKGACWLTGGGAKFSSITGTKLGEYGPDQNWGGNVNPGCSPVAGDGGSWNHIDHVLKLHFHGQAITVVDCGNVDGIPPGSTSPVTPFNFIEFTGTGTLKGIKGNRADYGTVNFWARCEDRNEPGSSGQQDGNLKDRYFLRVYDNSGNTLLLEDIDRDPTTVDPVTITKGNMQIHISSCDLTSAATSAPLGAPSLAARGASLRDFSFVAGPNPTGGSTFMHFALNRESNVSLAAFDVTGRLVRRLVSSRLPGGEHSLSWNLRDANGRRVSNGVYFMQLVVDGRMYSRTVTVKQ